MELLKKLEDKIVSLVAVIKDLKQKNESLQKELAIIHAQSKELKEENGQLLQENAQLNITLHAMENSVLQSSERMEATKVVVDDLIKSIDALVESEHQK